MRSLLALAVLLSTATVFAEAPKHGFTPEQSQEMALHNGVTAKNKFLNNLFEDFLSNKANLAVDRVPFAEYHQAGYLIFSADTDFGSAEAKKQMAQNLPEDMTLVIYTGSPSKISQKGIFQTYSQYISPERLKVIYLPAGERGFWARDGIPVPTWSYDVAGNEKFTVVDAKYYHPFEPDVEVSKYFKADYVQHSYYTEGGNFLSNARGECIVVNNPRVEQIPDTTFKDKYGCKSTLRLPFTKGIGHVDESVKFIDDDTVFSDDPGYQATLEQAGYNVIKIPRPANKFETYVNSLIINGTAFVPVFNQTKDAEVIKTYESFGLKVVHLNSSVLSNQGLGSLHCITMVYPPVEFDTLLEHIGASEVSGN